MPKLPYVKVGYYKGRQAALTEAMRLRKTGGYNAKVLRNTNPAGLPSSFQWVLWTQRKQR